MLKQIPSLKFNKWVKALAITSLPLALSLTPLPSFAQTALQCNVEIGEGPELVNTAEYEYSVLENDLDNKIQGRTNTLNNSTLADQSNIDLTASNIRDENGNLILGVGTITDGLEEELASFLANLTKEEKTTVINAAISKFLSLDQDVSTETGLSQVINKIAEALPSQKKNLITSISLDNILIALSGTGIGTLKILGLNQEQAQTAREQALSTIVSLNKTTPFWQARQDIFASTKTVLETENSPPSEGGLGGIVELNQARLEEELKAIRQGNQSTVTQGDKVNYEFLFVNKGKTQAIMELPSAATLQASGLDGSGQIVAVKYQKSNLTTGEIINEADITNQGTQIILQGQEQLKIIATLTIGNLPAVSASSISVGLGTDCGGKKTEASPTLNLVTVSDPLTDPFGQITGCGGETLPDYRGFAVGIFDVDSVIPTEVNSLTTLTATELPDNPNNNIPKGILPNTQNSNPFFITNQDKGKYSFLFDERLGQLDKGREYILIIKPPQDSIYDERRVKIIIGDTLGSVVNYTARSVDGRPISIADPLQRTEITGEIVLVEDAERIGLDIGVLDLGTSVCEAEEIRIDKTGDRATAEPGDTVLYRLVIRNLSITDLKTVKVSDILPQGFRFLDNSAKAAIGDQVVPLQLTQNKQNLTFFYDGVLKTGEVLNVVYAAQLTPDSMRGNGENLANVSAIRTDNGLSLSDGPAIHALKIEPGIVANCGTIIGRVFVDKNFDGEQQPGEPGVPNAIIFLEDGNRISTDEDGLYTVANILPGLHTGVLDLTSVPGYGLAPNLRFIERNSQSRMVRLAPGGLVKMNFAVTPAFGEEVAQ